MKPELEKLCTEYTANRDAVKKAFRWDKNELFAVCANIFCANGQAADADRLKECFGVIKKNTGAFSRFRSRKIRSILSSMLALGEDPAARMALADDYYRMLKRHFKGTEYLVLAAFLLADLADRSLTEETAARGREIYRRMNRQHRMLTDKTDSVFAMLLAFSGRPDDELPDDIEACYRVLKARFSGGAAQTAAQVLAVSDGTPEEKTQRVLDLYDALKEAGIRYGKSSELAPLAALSLADVPSPELAEEIREADEFLGTTKLYGTKDDDLAQRAMHAVMIVSDQYAGTRQVNVTVMTNTLDMLISKQQAGRVSFVIHAVEAVAKFLIDSGKSSDKTDSSKATETRPAGTADQPEEKKE